MVDCVIDIEPNVTAATTTKLPQQEQQADTPMPSHDPATADAESHEKDKKEEDAPVHDKDPGTLAPAAETMPQDEPVQTTTSDTSATTKQQIAGQLSEVLGGEESPAELAKLMPDEDDVDKNDATTVDAMQLNNSVASTEPQQEDKSATATTDLMQHQRLQRLFSNQGPMGLLDSCPCPGPLRPHAPAPKSVHLGTAADDKSG